MTAKETTAPVKAVFFDLDGTLLDTYELILVSMNYTLKTVLGKELPPELTMKKVGQPLAVQLADFAESEKQRDEMLECYREYNACFHDEMVRPFEGTEVTLKRLREQGLLMAVVTSKRHALAVRGLGLFGLESYFRFLIGADDCPRHKPDPEPLLYGVRLLALDPGSCVYVGDSPYDIQAANAAGITSIAALWGMFSEQSLVAEDPAYLCKSMQELSDLLNLIVTPSSCPSG